jgi:hypothetical protein
MMAEAGAAMGNIDLDKRSQRLMEEGTRNELAALARLRQEDNRLKSAKMLREEIEETLHPMEVMDMEKRQDFKRAVNVAVDLIRAQSGGPSEHRSPSFVHWMMAKTMERCETGQALSDKLIQECLRQPGNRTSVWLILRSRMENYTGRETPARCPTNIEVQTSLDSLADSVNVSALPLDDIDKFRQGTDFQIALSGARHGLTEQVARDTFPINNWSFDMSIEPPDTERLCLVPTNQEHNQTKLHSWVAGLRAFSHQHGCLDTRIEHALLAGILPSWNHELSPYANNLKGLRLEISRLLTTKAGKTRFKPSTAHLGTKSYQAPQIFIHIGIDRLATQQRSLADITRDILNKHVTLQMNMVADTDKIANNVITFSILPRNSRPATGQDEAWGRAKDRLRQERQMLDDEINKIVKISVSLAHGRGEYDEVGVDLIRSICQDITSPARSRTSQKMGDTILDILKDNQPERLHEILAGPAPEAYVAAKVSGFPTFKAFFPSDEYKKYSTTQKTTTFLQLIRNHLHERGVFTEAAEAIYDGKKGLTPDDTLLIIFTTSSWKTCTSPPAQGEPILLPMANSIKKRLKAVGAVPFRISSSNSKPAPDLTFTPLEEDEPDNRAEDQTILRILQRGDLIFVPKLPDAPRSIQRSTAWSDIPLKSEWASLQIKNIPDLQRPTAAPGILLDLLDRGEAKLLEMSTDGASMWILTAYLDAILTLTPTALKDLCPTRSRETNRHLVLDPIKEAMKRGLLLHGTRGVWLENNPFETTTVGSHPADLSMEPFSKRDPAALPLAITTMIGVPKPLGQGLSDVTNQVLRDLVEANLLEPLLKKGHTLLIRQGSDLKTALLQTDKIKVGCHYTSSVEVPEEDIAMALDNTFPRKFPAEWGIVILSVGDDAEYPFETADFTPQLHSPDPLHIANIGSHILSQGVWITSSSALKRFRQKKSIIQQPLSSPRGIMWIYPGFQEPPNDTTHRSLLQLLGPQYGTLQFLSALGVRTDFKSSMEVLETLRDCRRQAILSELRLITEHRPIFIPAHSIRAVEGQRQAVPLDRSRSHQVQQNWLPRLSIAANNTEILQAAISEAKNDPKGVAAHILENHGVLLTTFNQFETVCLSTVMSALPEALLKEPVSMAELMGDMDYVISFEEDRREGSGGPAQPLP